MFDGVSPWHTINVPFIPAFGGVSSVRITSADSSGQTPMEVIVYVYVSPTFVHIPPVWGVPKSALNNSISVGVVPWQTVKAPFMPALGGISSITITSAVAFGHRPAELTV